MLAYLPFQGNGNTTRGGLAEYGVFQFTKVERTLWFYSLIH